MSHYCTVYHGQALSYQPFTIEADNMTCQESAGSQEEMQNIWLACGSSRANVTRLSSSLNEYQSAMHHGTLQHFRFTKALQRSSVASDLGTMLPEHAYTYAEHRPLYLFKYE